MATAPIAITQPMLTAADTTNSTAYYTSLLPAFNEYALAYGITTGLRIAHFLAQIGHESSFRCVEENGNYDPKRMRQVFGCKGGGDNYDQGRDDCKAGQLRPKLWTQPNYYAHNPKNLLSYVYGGRYNNGDEASGDGYLYRGRGMMQLTFKDNYARFTASHNARNAADPRDFVAHPELVITDARYGVESAFFFWDSRNINAAADADNVARVTLLVNGGDIGLPDRKLRLNKVKAVLGLPV